MLAFVPQCAVHGFVPPNAAGIDSWCRSLSTLTVAGTRAQNQCKIQITGAIGQQNKPDAVAWGAFPSKWSNWLKISLPIFAVSCFVNPTLTSVAVVSFLVGRASSNSDVESDIGSERMLIEVEKLRLRIVDLENTEEKKNQKLSCSCTGNHITTCRPGRQGSTTQGCEAPEVRGMTEDSAKVQGVGQSQRRNQHSGMEDPRYNSRMRERILFLWGEQGLKWFGLDEEMYWPQLARSADSEAFLQRNKRFLESVFDNADQEK